MIITSDAFRDGGAIPQHYTCDGTNISPPLFFTDVPENAASLALFVDDPDSPHGVWNHWTLWNIPPEITRIPEGGVPQGALQGTTTFGTIGYGGPCPRSGQHRYLFILYALDTMLPVARGAQKEELLAAMSEHIIAQVELVGTYACRS